MALPGPLTWGFCQECSQGASVGCSHLRIQLEGSTFPASLTGCWQAFSLHCIGWRHQLLAKWASHNIIAGFPSNKGSEGMNERYRESQREATI